jgi:hypothetical protein
MQLAEDGDVVPLVDRLSVLQLRFQGPHALGERSRKFNGSISVSRTAYILCGRLVYQPFTSYYTAKAFFSDIGHLLE